MTNRAKFGFLLALGISIAWSGCQKEDSPLPGAPGDVIQYDSITTLNLSNLEDIRNTTLDQFINDSTFDVGFYRNRFAMPQFSVTL